MKNTAVELLITLLSSWAVYGACQQDAVLPTICGVILLISFFKDRRHVHSGTAVHVTRVPWANLIGLSLFIGWLWRIFLPDSSLLAMGTPGAIKIMQTGFVVLSLLLWFQRGSPLHPYSLRMISWIIVALSINVRFDTFTTIVFRIFCSVNIWFILIKPHINTLSSLKKSRAHLPGVFMTALYLAFFIVVTAVLYVTTLSLVELGDQTFMRFVHDYMQPYRHPFFSLKPTLNLRGPGYSGRNIHPVLEIDRGNQSVYYLSLQVFEHYDNGVWKEAEGATLQPLPNAMDPAQPGIGLIMFDHLQGVIPAPDGVSRVKSQHSIFKHDENKIIYAPELSVLKASFQVNGEPPAAAPLSEKRMNELTRLSPTFKESLSPYVNAVTGTEEDPLRISRMIESYFRQNFEYELNVWFAANESGLMTMLRDRSPAYCSYFATAMALMLRERGIPARVRVGFLVTEKINDGKQFLARVRDAHAWVEALLPEGSGYRWVRFDPTPAASRDALLNSGRPLNAAADWMYRLQGRIKSEIVTMDTTGMMAWLLVFVLSILLLKNYKDILRRVAALKSAPQHRSSAPKKGPHHAAAFYESFENLMKKTCAVRRSETETDEQFFARLKNIPLVSPEALTLCGSFLREYHAVRFGGKENHNLQESLQAIEQKAGKSPSRRR